MLSFELRLTKTWLKVKGQDIYIHIILQIIKELLCVKYGLVSLPLFDVSQIDFMLVTL